MATIFFELATTLKNLGAKWQGKIFIGVNCDTKDGKVAVLASTISGGKRTYKYSCYGTLTTGEAKMYCYMHYWEC